MFPTFITKIMKWKDLSIRPKYVSDNKHPVCWRKALFNAKLKTGKSDLWMNEWTKSHALSLCIIYNGNCSSSESDTSISLVGTTPATAEGERSIKVRSGQLKAFSSSRGVFKLSHAAPVKLIHWVSSISRSLGVWAPELSFPEKYTIYHASNRRVIVYNAPEQETDPRPSLLLPHTVCQPGPRPRED